MQGDSVTCFGVFATQQMPKNWRTRKKCLKIKISEHHKESTNMLLFIDVFSFFMNHTGKKLRTKCLSERVGYLFQFIDVQQANFSTLKINKLILFEF